MVTTGLQSQAKLGQKGKWPCRHPDNFQKQKMSVVTTVDLLYYFPQYFCYKQGQNGTAVNL